MQGKDKNSNLFKAQSLEELLESSPDNKVIADNLIKAWTFINNERYENIVCTISGGSDSDDMLDIIWRCDKDNKVDFVWFDTGLEYQALHHYLNHLILNKQSFYILDCLFLTMPLLSCLQ